MPICGSDYAFATAMASGRNLEGKPMELIQQALKVDPENAKALQLAGTAAFQAKDYNKAIDYWNRVLKQVPPDSEAGRLIVQRIDEARTLAAGNSNRTSCRERIFFLPSSESFWDSLSASCLRAR